MADYAPFVNIIGRVMYDPEVKSVGESQVVKLAVSQRTGFKPEGEKYPPSEVHRVDVWDGERDFQQRLFAGARSLRKGQLVAVEGMEKKNGEYTNIRALNVWRVIDIEVEDDESEDI